MKGLQNGDMAVKDAERQNIAAFGRGDCKGNDGGRHLPYNDFGSWLHSRFPYKVQKISVNAGFSCPNRDGRIGFGGCTFCAPASASLLLGGAGAHTSSHISMPNNTPSHVLNSVG